MVELKMNKVTKSTRAGKNGRVTTCPHCDYSLKTYHFEWASAMCPNCEKWVDKYDWLLKED